MNNIKDLAKTFKALSDEKRLKIIQMLYCCEQCACDLEDKLDLSQSGLSYHMKILKEAKLVTSRVEGKWTYYKVSDEGINEIRNFIDEVSKTTVKN